MAEQVDPELSAKTARLRYVCDDDPGIRRERDGDGFRYLSSKGEVVAETNIDVVDYSKG